LRKIVAGEPLENPWADAHPVQVAHLLEHSSGLLDITREEFDHNAPFSSLEAAFAWRPQARDTASLMGTGRDWTNLCVRGSGGTDTVVTAMAICPTSLTTVSPMRTASGARDSPWQPSRSLHRTAIPTCRLISATIGG
jgi:hypothetical protein